MIGYNPNQSYATTALTVSHTVLPAVFTEVTFWLFFIVHFTLWFFKDPMPMVHKNPHCEVNWSHMEVLVAFSTFFLITYAGDVFHRYFEVYYAVKMLFSGVTDFILEMKFYTKAKNVLWLRLSARYLLAALCIFLNRPLENREKVPAKEYEQLIQRRLLRPEEVAALSDLLRQHAGTVVCHWAARVVHQSFTEMGMTSNQMRSLLDRILFIRQAQQSVLDTVKSPLPYPYFHLLNLVLLVKLSILAYGYARMNSIFAPIGFFLTELVFCGSMELNSQLADPFGDDDVDFPLRQWLDVFIDRTCDFLEYFDAFDEHQDCAWGPFAANGHGFPSIVQEGYSYRIQTTTDQLPSQSRSSESSVDERSARATHQHSAEEEDDDDDDD
mmetsp:Transcript_68983/g.197880  ORF Transcript_68983/g.197880 Transcript_68983/m.197880 type:complete len:383 (-) Transcript_68983:84-1232(-)|eukprot:CAMPEP_0177164628 /NCGR_PEP_ID=MMETSP0367-20130122/7050_1 /TAXON_ID=447022 ORGANISM="Scrippsiella hangoei-like, Strain SHHI-4" /NCGR_SAMPLE_ID=MMETSP0367 /ASSEMBLY_ACC=CAM_ASM_000362 /LENGTH=382 /DNA_ID=CAMNT_0018610539 /DNA_START=97 /DNA_END=1245 /DNA_ORIENTATION=+